MSTIVIPTFIIYLLIGAMAGIARVSINFYDLPFKEWLFLAIRYSWLGMFWSVSMYLIFDSLSKNTMPNHYRYFVVVFGSVTAMEILTKAEEVSSSVVATVSDLLIKMLGHGKIEIKTDDDIDNK